LPTAQWPSWAMCDITVCDLTATGVQDSVIASLAFERALARGFGQSFEG